MRSSAAGIEHPVVVIGFGADQVEAALEGRVPTVRQDPQLGTADAVRCGLGRVPPEARHVLVTMGDVPLLPGELFQHLLREQAEGDAAVALLSARLDDATRLRPHRARARMAMRGRSSRRPTPTSRRGPSTR